MKRRQFTMKRESDVHLNTYCWEPESNTEIRGVVQISHGMAEHILRYNRFSKFLTEQGLVVYGNDHRGHGGSITAPDDEGFFAEQNGFEKVVEDMHALTLHIKEQHPDVPILLFGHSLGSFLSRRYIQLYRDDVAGVILSGTGGSQGIMGIIGLIIAKLERHRIGARTPSPLMDKLIFGSFNKVFQPVRTPFDFLSRDDVVVNAYIDDDKCGFICSSSFYVDLITGIELVTRNEKRGNMPKDIPVYLTSGDMDPVGKYGKSVLQVYDLYRQQKLVNVSLKFYPEARHEVLNETNKQEVYADIRDWIETVISE